MAGCFSFGKSDMADCFSFGKSDMAGCFSVPCPLVLAQVQRVEQKPPIFLLSRFGVCAPSAAAPSARRRHVDSVASPPPTKPTANNGHAQTAPTKATPTA